MIETQDIQITFNEEQKKYLHSIRSKTLFIVCYLDVDKIKTIINEYIKPFHYAISPCHDKDVFDSGDKKGEFKKPHYHIILMFENRRYATRIARLLNTCRLEPIVTEEHLKNSYIYLTHDNCEDKVKYEKSLRQVDCIEFWDNLENTSVFSEDNSIEIIDNIINKVPLRDMVKKYGKNFVYHFNQYYAMAHFIKQEESEQSKTFLERCDCDTEELILNKLYDDYDPTIKNIMVGNKNKE